MSHIMTAPDLRAWRARRRWTQEQAADALGYSRKGYAAAEDGDGELARKLTLTVAGYDAAECAPVQSLENTTLGDLSEDGNVKEAEIELDRCTTDADFARWARRWGRSAVGRLHETAGIGMIDDFDELSQEATRLEMANAKLRETMERAIKVGEADDFDPVATLDKVLETLEAAL